MQNDKPVSVRSEERWAHFRFSVVGVLLAAPPPRGELKGELERLAATIWKHPISGVPRVFKVKTIEHWYYQAKNEVADPVAVLQRKSRSDRNRTRAITAAAAEHLKAQHQSHPTWSYQLHSDNLRAAMKRDASLGSDLEGGAPSYASVRRYMKANGLLRRRRRRPRLGTDRDRVIRAPEDFEPREVRSFEVSHVHGLWHLDFHHASRKIVDKAGLYRTPVILGVLDDHSRLCCHAQWYWAETAESLVHALSQAIQKRGLPRALLTDNGAPMLAAETVGGLTRLGITHKTTLPYSPHQNGKQEVLWASLEGRLMAMLEGNKTLTLDELNRATQAWVEMEYNKAEHSEIGCPPYKRFIDGPSLGRESPSAESLRLAFRRETTRAQRRSDGTITLDGVRYEVPGRYRDLLRPLIRFASWDKRCVHLVDEQTGSLLCPLYPLDRGDNADGRRRTAQPPPDSPPPSQDSGSPLLAQLIDDYEATGLPLGYLKHTPANDHEEN